MKQPRPIPNGPRAHRTRHGDTIKHFEYSLSRYLECTGYFSSGEYVLVLLHLSFSCGLR
jgi:hypothetical protein